MILNIITVSYNVEDMIGRIDYLKFSKLLLKCCHYPLFNFESSLFSWDA